MVVGFLGTSVLLSYGLSILAQFLKLLQKLQASTSLLPTSSQLYLTALGEQPEHFQFKGQCISRGMSELLTAQSTPVDAAFSALG